MSPDKFAQELVQAFIKYIRDSRSFQLFDLRIGHFVTTLTYTILIGQIVQRILNAPITKGQRTRHSPVEDEVVGDVCGIEVPFMGPAV